jgi:DNA-directed RNA polymerase subunit RPC12/RpoP
MTDRKISLKFDCFDCGKEITITSEQNLFDLVDTQLVGESKKLSCWECVND